MATVSVIIIILEVLLILEKNLHLKKAVLHLFQLQTESVYKVLDIKGDDWFSTNCASSCATIALV